MSNEVVVHIFSLAQDHILKLNFIIFNCFLRHKLLFLYQGIGLVSIKFLTSSLMCYTCGNFGFEVP